MPPIIVLFCKNLPAAPNNLLKKPPPPLLTSLLYLGALYAFVAVCPRNKSLTSGLAKGATTLSELSAPPSKDVNVDKPNPPLAPLATLLLGGDGTGGPPPPNNPPTVLAILPKPLAPNNPPTILLVSRCLVGRSINPKEANLKAAKIGEAGLYTLVSSNG